MNKIFLSSLFCFILMLIGLDRHFFKQNQSFSIRNIYSILPYEANWNFEQNSLLSAEELSSILDQPFTYLGKGHQSYIFESANGRYVLKFYRFPSHLRPFPWLNHPVGYHFDEKRIGIAQYNEKKLQDTLESYQLAFSHFHEESGLLMIHLAKTTNFTKHVILVDSLKQSYLVPLQETLFLLQKKGELIFPTLKKMLEEDREDDAKKLIQNIFSLISQRMEKGLKDNDAILKKNYGCFGTCPFQLDVGRLTYDPTIQNSASIRQEQAHVYLSMKEWIQQNFPDFLSSYNDLIPETIKINID